MDNKLAQLELLGKLFRDRYDVDTHMWIKMTDHIQLRTVKKDKVFTAEIGSFGFVLSGLLLKQDEKEHVLDFIDQADFLLQTRASYGTTQLICKEDALIAVVKPDEIKALVGMHQIIFTAFSDIYMKLFERRQIRSRLVSLSVAERKIAFYRLYPKIATRRPLYEIASYLGTNPNYLGSK